MFEIHLFFRLLCRLTYALCLNFLSVIHLDSHITGVLDLEDTAFTSVCEFQKDDIRSRSLCVSSLKQSLSKYLLVVVKNLSVF